MSKSANFDTQNPFEIVHRGKDFGRQNPWTLAPRILGTDLGIIRSFIQDYENRCASAADRLYVPAINEHEHEEAEENELYFLLLTY